MFSPYLIRVCNLRVLQIDLRNIKYEGIFTVMLIMGQIYYDNGKMNSGVDQNYM